MNVARLCALIAAIGLAAAAPSPRDALRAVRTAWNQAYSAGDLDALMKLYDDEAVSMPPGGPTLVGKKAIRADLTRFLGANRVYETTAVKEVVVSGDLAMERAEYRAEIQPARGRPTVERGKHVVAYRRGADGAWRVRWEIWNAE